MSKLVEGIVFIIIGLVIVLADIFVTKSLAVGVVGGLFLGAGIVWVMTELFNKSK